MATSVIPVILAYVACLVDSDYVEKGKMFLMFFNVLISDIKHVLMFLFSHRCFFTTMTRMNPWNNKVLGHYVGTAFTQHAQLSDKTNGDRN